MPAAKKIAFKIDAVDLPSDRRVHNKPMARFGGLAIFIAIVVSVAISALGTKYLG